MKSRILIGLLIVLAPLLAPLKTLADEAHPRLFLNQVGNVRLHYDADANRMTAESRGDVRELGKTFPKQ